MTTNTNPTSTTNTSQLQLNTPSSSRWLLGWMNYVAKWMGGYDDTAYQFPMKDNGEIDLTPEDWSEWEWILSSSEEFLQKHNQGQMEKTESELNILRGTSSQFRLRPHFLLTASRVLHALSATDKASLLESLDAGKRSKVIADAVKQYEDSWRQWIKENFFKEDNKQESWKKFDNFYSEQPYTKNTVGILREVAWQASHGQNGTLTNKVLADITWSIWNALRGSVRGALERDLSQEELLNIADTVCEIQTTLSKLWAETVRNSKGGKEREGILVQKWKVEDAKRIEKLKKRKSVDGKWDPRPVTIKATERAHNHKEISDFLAQSLYFRVRKV